MPAGQVAVPVTVLQRAQMTQIGAHQDGHRLTCRLRQTGGTWLRPDLALIYAGSAGGPVPATARHPGCSPPGGKAAAGGCP